MSALGQPEWRLRDYLRAESQRCDRQRLQCEAAEQVRAAAAEDGTYGYRRVWHRLRACGVRLGRERVRRLMGQLGLQPPAPVKKARPRTAALAPSAWPAGRRLQIDATRLTLDDGVAWVYLVEDVASRQCLAASAASRLCQHRAAETLRAGDQQLRRLGLQEPRLIQSDGGSDFTAQHFQSVCHELGQWVRARVAQVGGMGILEQLNRTFKHEFLFRHEFSTLAQLQALLPTFLTWYNQQRLHSRLAYRTPASVLAVQAAAVLS